MATRGLLRYCGRRSATRRLSYHHKGGTSCEPDEELHPNWSGLERRLQSRVPREKGHGVPEGRTNLKPSEEDFWHKAGVYDYSEASSSSPEIATREPACARLSTVKVSAENVPRVVALYKTSVAPVLQVKGFCGAQVFSDRAAGTVQSLTLWQSWGDLEEVVGNSRYAKAMRSLEGLIEAPPDVVDTEVACSILPTTGGGDVSSGDS
ncbi:unnamed protein product [Ectocarpus sp. CCAP 1310/34]|nr:unnamed protein product [Ectocarpus sp. CCAP 1310/34]